MKSERIEKWKKKVRSLDWKKKLETRRNKKRKKWISPKFYQTFPKKDNWISYLSNYFEEMRGHYLWRHCPDSIPEYKFVLFRFDTVVFTKKEKEDAIKLRREKWTKTL